MMMTLMYALSYNATPTFSAYQLQLRIIDCGDIYIKSIKLCRFLSFFSATSRFCSVLYTKHISKSLINLIIISRRSEIAATNHYSGLQHMTIKWNNIKPRN